MLYYIFFCFFCVLTKCSSESNRSQQEINNEQIGYRRNRGSDGTIKKSIMPTEGRETAVAEVTLIDNNTQKIVWGPQQIRAEVDNDYVDQDSLNDLSFVNPQGNRVTVLTFSLGQLESIASAQEAALTPLYRTLAQKIIDAILAEGLYKKNEKKPSEK